MAPDLEEMDAVRIHGALWTSIQKNGGTAKRQLSESYLYKMRSIGGIQASAGFITEVITIAAEFGTFGKAIAFMFIARPLLLKWIELRAGRSIEIQVGEKKVKIHGSPDVDLAVKIFRELDKETTPEDAND